MLVGGSAEPGHVTALGLGAINDCSMNRVMVVGEGI